MNSSLGTTPSSAKKPTKIPWPHAPTHKLGLAGTYFVTAGTYRKEALFAGDDRLDALHGGLLKYAKKYGWNLEAWAVFPNHYHFIAHSPESESEGENSANSLSDFLNHFHGRSSAWVNKRDGIRGRKVWHNFWDTQLTFEKSYLARLSYVHQNAVKHGLVPEGKASAYRWCSAAWFERTATPAQVKTIYGFKTDQLKVLDDF